MAERGAVPMVIAAGICVVVVMALEGQRPTPGPKTFGPANVMTVPDSAIEQYVKHDLSFDATLGAADEPLVDFQRVEIGTERAKLARIQPETKSYALDSARLASGRIIARIWSEVEVPSLRLGPWWTWWWVDQKGAGRTWRSVFIPESAKFGTRVILPEALELTRHVPGQWRQGIARFWIVRDTYGGKDPIWLEIWGTCGGCCKQRLVVAAPSK